MLDPTILGAYGARNAITGAVRAAGAPGLAVAGAGALGAALYPSTEFISNNMILDSDFNEMMSNPFLSPSAKAQLFEKAQLNIIQKQSNFSFSVPDNLEDLGQIYTPLPEPKKPSILYTPLIERGPNILTTPGEEKKPIVLVTPEYETPSWHHLPGYGIYDGPDLSVLYNKNYPDTVDKVNNRYPINGDWANKEFPLHDKNSDLAQKYPNGVKFNEKGFPDFSPYAEKTVVSDKLTGKQYKDENIANELIGSKKTPKGYTWHHVEDGKTMQLVPRELHKVVNHTGGRAVIKEKDLNKK